MPIRIQAALLALIVFVGNTTLSHNSAAGQVAEQQTSKPDELRVLSWNIWHGGREDGDDVGPQRVADVIQDSEADVVALQETYGSGELISESLKFQFHPRGTNVSILSRFPVVEDISVFEEFKCVGAILELPDKKRVAFYSIWLPYNAEIWESGTRDVTHPHSMLDACAASAADLEKIWAAIDARLSGPQYENVPVFIAGDFNSMSHLDYADVAKDQHGVTLDWPTSHVLIDAGFRDAWRETSPVIDRQADRTWTPRFPDQEQDRIDFIYYRADDWQATESRVTDSHRDKFPSDHAALLTVFRQVNPGEFPKRDFRVVSYNIKHGEGMDNAVDLDRAAEVLRRLRPDFVGLQEIDERVPRSGTVNQTAELGRKLGMHAAFGPFMDLQEGRYGMAVLSRYPVRNVHNVRLPEGNEPRIALAVEVRLPGGDSLMLVNVHFDWVRDDTFRFAQAIRLAEFLDDLTMPFVLMGDFNDTPRSCTLALLRQGKLEAKKPADDSFTFSSTRPDREIDFIFAAPVSSWKVLSTQVLDEPVASDHRPVVADLHYAPEGVKK